MGCGELLRESGAVDTPCANANDGGGGGRDSPSVSEDAPEVRCAT